MKKCLKKIVKLLVILGALNCGWYAATGTDMICHLFGGCMGMVPMGAKIVFGLIGIAGVLCLICFFKNCCGCKKCDCGCNSCCKK